MCSYLGHLNLHSYNSPSMYKYGKCPKILYSKVSDKMAYANSADPNPADPKGVI